MTTDTLPTLTGARPQGRFIVLTYTRLDGSPATLTAEAPLPHSMDARVRHPVRRLTIFPDGDLPHEFQVEADRIMTISAILAHAPGSCEMCGKFDGSPLASRGGDLYCPACTIRAELIDATERSLEAIVGSALGAWAAQWTAAGLPLRDLTDALDSLGGGYLRPDYRQRYIRTHLRRLMRAYRAARGADRASV